MHLYSWSSELDSLKVRGSSSSYVCGWGPSQVGLIHSVWPTSKWPKTRQRIIHLYLDDQLSLASEKTMVVKFIPDYIIPYFSGGI